MPSSSRRLVKDPERYKTVLCATWIRTGECPYGRKCQFAHGKDELRSRTAPPLSSTVPRLQGGLAMNCARPAMSHQSMPPWPAPGHPQLGAAQPQPSLPLPPLPPGPPPSSHLERGLLLSPQMGGTPAQSMPPVAPPTAALSDFQVAALAQQLVAQQLAAAQQQLPSHVVPPAPPLSQLGGPSRVGPLDCPPALLPGAAAALAPSAAPPLPAALVPGSMPAPAPLPAPLPAASLPAAMAPSMAPPLAAPQSHAPPLPVSAAPAMPLASAPTAEPPLMTGAVAPSESTVTRRPVARPAAPSAESGSASMQPTPLNVSDELATFAMKCVLADKELRDQTNCFHPSELWSPLRFNDATGKLEARHGSSWPESAGLCIEADKQVDSPIEPGLSKRDVSYSTQMVRRAVSFVFTDSLDDPASPLHERNRGAQSPHTAIAA